MDQDLLDFLDALLTGNDTGPDSIGGFFKKSLIDGAMRHETTIGIPKTEKGYPQLALDEGSAVTQQSKEKFREKGLYHLNIWHSTDQKTLLRASSVAEQITGMIHNQVTSSGLYLQVTSRTSLQDKNGKLSRVQIKLEAIRTR